MKPGNNFLALLYFSFLLVCISCHNQANNSQQNEAIAPAPSIDKSKFQISSDTAMNRIKRYAEFSDNIGAVLQDGGIFADSTRYLVYGQKVQIDELKSVLNSATDQHNELYIMLGIDNVTNETDIVFSLRCDTIQCNNMPITPNWEYFDFTRPCPQYCPEWFDQWKLSTQ